MRAFRVRTVVTVLAWKLAAMVLLPVALCCQAMMVPGGDGSPPCCGESGHGAACPLDGASDFAGDSGDAHPGDADPGHADPGHAEGGLPATDAPRMYGCGTLDAALLGLLNLTGFTPDAPVRVAAPAGVGLLASSGESGVSLASPPPSPPPRV